MLNDPQRRRLSITFRLLEEELDNLELSLKTDDYTGILYEIKNDVPLRTRDLLIDKIAAIKERIGVIAERFALEKGNKELSRSAIGELSLLGVSVEEVMSKRLRGYGEIAEGLGKALDPELDKVRDILWDMLKVLTNDETKDKTGKEDLK